MRQHQQVYDAMLEAEARLFSTVRAWFRRALEVNAGILQGEYGMAPSRQDLHPRAREGLFLPVLQ